MTLLRPIEIIEKYPGIKKAWSYHDIGQLFHLGLVRGEKLRRGCLINENDVKKIFGLRYSNGESDK